MGLLVILASITGGAVLIWISLKARPLGPLPYRWGLFLGVVNAIGGSIVLWFALSAFSEGTFSERSVLFFECVLGLVAGLGLCRRKRWGVVAWFANGLIGTLPLLLEAVYEAANGQQKAQRPLVQGLGALVFLIVNVIYFKKRWKLMGPEPIPPSALASYADLKPRKGIAYTHSELEAMRERATDV